MDISLAILLFYVQALQCKEQEVELESMDRSLYTSPSTGVLANYTVLLNSLWTSLGIQRFCWLGWPYSRIQDDHQITHTVPLLGLHCGKVWRWYGSFSCCRLPGVRKVSGHCIKRHMLCSCTLAYHWAIPLQTMLWEYLIYLVEGMLHNKFVDLHRCIFILGIEQGASVTYIRSSPLPRSSSHFLLRSLAESLLEKVNVVLKKTDLTASLPYLFSLSGLLANCIFGVEFSMLRRWDWLHAR
jgi:hypothetical protein